MKTRRTVAALTAALLSAPAALSGCSGQPAADTPRLEERTVALKPAKLPVRVGVLAGELAELAVVQRINATTGEVVYAPQLRGNLKLKNTSTDEAVRLVNGRVEYLDATGARIALPEDRADTSFQFHSHATDRLDPGAEMLHRVDVPFPAPALNGTMLSEIRLSLTYLPAPFREDAVEIPVVLARP